MKDSFGDEIVLGPTGDGHVSLYCKDRDSGFRTGAVVDMVLTPKKARKLASRLVELADAIEADQ